jgi:EAL domain-containing protein (putative c-di-GMP-specific phosphodiesterase class I)/CheY-like chemotaxis protein
MWPTFAETLPLGLGDELDSTMAPPMPARRQPSILLVDDDPFLLGMQARVLRSMGYPMIGTAGSADAALSLLLNDPQAVDVILCDLNMPGTDGIEFLRKLNASAFCGSVILLSGEGPRIMHSVQKLMTGSRIVILGALEKPASRAALRALLDSWVLPQAAAPVAAPPIFTSAELHAANRHGQWVLHYQPKVALATGTLAGMEALVRWNHPEQGLVHPGRFIGLAQECGAIHALTEWVLHDALRQLARWHAQGLTIHMAVNVSIENLRAPDFADRVRDLALQTCTSPQDLTLEVSEASLGSPSAYPLESFVRLRMQRFGLAIDDFGTGHSSLAQLRDVPFTELKIDRSLARGARHNLLTRPMLEGSIGIAKRLGMLSAAQGVETEDDWQLLRELGCDLAQGEFIGPPAAPSQVRQWLEQWKSRRAELIQA